jgi:hypothetical protein
MCHLMCPLASILAEPSLLSDLLRVLRYAILSGGRMESNLVDERDSLL